MAKSNWLGNWHDVMEQLSKQQRQDEDEFYAFLGEPHVLSQVQDCADGPVELRGM
jgi:hypothetical protein